MIIEALNKLSLYILPVLISFIIIYGLIKKINVYEAFVDGAKDGALCTIKIFPYLLAIIVAISMIRASGFFDIITSKFSYIFNIFNIPCDVFPIMIVRSLSGSAVLGLLTDIVDKYGVDSYITKLSSIMIGSSETTFYVLCVYFGAVGIKNVRYALCVGLLADFIGIVTSLFISKIFFL